MRQATPEWLVLVWRLPAGGSRDRVWIWRTLRRLGGASLTPGAAAVPYCEELEEQLDWLAQDVEERRGTAWVLPVVGLSSAEASRLREQANADRAQEYDALRRDAEAFQRRLQARERVHLEFSERLSIDKQLLAFQRRFHKIRQRDHFAASQREPAARAVDACLVFRQGVSRKLLEATDTVA
jgi:hypothetical protein